MFTLCSLGPWIVIPFISSQFSARYWNDETFSHLIFVQWNGSHRMSLSFHCLYCHQYGINQLDTIKVPISARHPAVILKIYLLLFLFLCTSEMTIETVLFKCLRAEYIFHFHFLVLSDCACKEISWHKPLKKGIQVIPQAEWNRHYSPAAHNVFPLKLLRVMFCLF